MRCLKCGYDNEPNAQVCIKCGKPYNISAPVMPQQNYAQQPMNMPQQGYAQQPMNAPQHPQPRPTVVDASMMQMQSQPQAQPQQQHPQPRPTVLDSNAAMANASAAAAPQACPACGYPVQGRSMCPACGYPIAQSAPAQPAQPAQPRPVAQPVQPQPAQSAPAMPGIDMNMTVVCDKCGSEVSIANKFCPCCGERIHLATQAVVRRKPQPKCSLTIIPEEGENIAAKTNTYEGKSIILNRDNTEPGNRTITSREQAELTCEDGKWFIENKSDYGSTYIMAKRKIELQPGDIVVLGDRTFEFK